MSNNILDLPSDLAQFVSLYLLLKDSTNSQLMEELNRQNREYLAKIIEQNELIIKQNEEILKFLGDKNAK